MTFRVLVCAAGVSVAMCLGPQAGVAQSRVDSADVYSAVLASLLKADSSATVLVYPQARSESLDTALLDALRGEGMRLEPGLVRSYEAANLSETALSVEFATSRATLLEPQQVEVLDVDHERGWEILRRDFGEEPSLVYFSQPGMSADGDVALVYYVRQCAPMQCVEGHLVRLRGGPAGWRVVRDVTVWIS